MAESQIWECPKCKQNREVPVRASAFYASCKCGNKREWKLRSGPPLLEERDVRLTTKKKEEA